MRPWLASLFFAGAVFAQDFRTDVSLVRVEASVIDGNRSVTGLKKEAFRVFDNRQPVEVLHFSEDEEPLDLILLFDVSGSMKPVIQKISMSASKALQQLMRGDRVQVMCFNTRAWVAGAFTSNVDEVDRTIREKVLGGKIRGGTHILMGADEAAKQFLMRERERRRAVLIITDDYGQRSRRETPVVHDYWEADASISAIVIRSGFEKVVLWYGRVAAPHMMLLEEGIGGVVKKTGGDMIQSNKPDEAFAEMIGRIRRRYCLYYRQPDDSKPGESRAIKVDLTPEARSAMTKARVVSRYGYLVPKAPVTSSTNSSGHSN